MQKRVILRVVDGEKALVVRKLGPSRNYFAPEKLVSPSDLRTLTNRLLNEVQLRALFLSSLTSTAARSYIPAGIKVVWAGQRRVTDSLAVLNLTLDGAGMRVVRGFDSNIVPLPPALFVAADGKAATKQVVLDPDTAYLFGQMPA